MVAQLPVVLMQHVFRTPDAKSDFERTSCLVKFYLSTLSNIDELIGDELNNISLKTVW